MVFFFSEAAIEKKIRCQLISSHFIAPPLFFVDVKRCENVERLPQTTLAETYGEKTSKNNQSRHIRIPRIGLHNGDDSTVSKPNINQLSGHF